MAFPANSGKYGKALKDMNNRVNPIALVSDTLKLALYTNSIATTNYDTDTSYASAPYNANEITGTGYTAAGTTLTTKTLTLGTKVMNFGTDDAVWSSATFSAVRGGLCHDTTVTTPTSDPAIFLVTFGADFAVTAGTFTVHPASGIWFTDTYAT